VAIRYILTPLILPLLADGENTPRTKLQSFQGWYPGIGDFRNATLPPISPSKQMACQLRGKMHPYKIQGIFGKEEWWEGMTMGQKETVRGKRGQVFQTSPGHGISYYGLRSYSHLRTNNQNAEA
jgi:hypothetical protein